MNEDDAYSMFFGVGALICIPAVQQLMTFFNGQHIDMLLCSGIILVFVVLCLFMGATVWAE